MGNFTLFGQPASPATLTSDAVGYTMGVQFSVSQSATLTAIWFFSATGAAVLPGTILLYAVSGTSLVHSETASWSGAAGSGWVQALFSSPPSLTASTNYKAAVAQSSAANWYSTTANYWSSGAGSGGITNGPLSAPNNAGGDGGQATFNTSVPAYPNTSFNAGNYWVDPQVTTGDVTVSGAVSALALAAPAGTPAITLPGPVAGLALAAPAGYPAVNPVPGAVAGLTLAAPAGSVFTKNRIVQGQPSSGENEPALRMKLWL
jgi:Domain of unknown function (DUF4082)